ncbi:MAG TPA: hypothetical protein VME68_13560 [Acidobacteriaceae bacterium]|nr:hypothetical protein [Acidobacteriaceae bacterium]
MNLLRSLSVLYPHESIADRRSLRPLGIAITVLAAISTPLTLAQQSNNAQLAASRPEVAKLSADQVATAYYPEDMVDPDGQAGENYCAVAYENAADGAPATVFAVYPWGPPGKSGEMWEFSRQPSGDYQGRQVGDPKLDLNASDRCNISVTDAGHNVGKVIEVALWGNRNSSSYLFRWDGTHLTTAGPVDLDPSGRWLDTDLNNMAFVPIFEDGALGVVSGPLDTGDSDEVDSDQHVELYRFDGKTYSFYATGLYMGEFSSCSSSSCGPDHAEFDVPKGSMGSLVLRIGNGDASGAKRVAGGIIALNGKVVAEIPGSAGGTRVTVRRLAHVAAGKNKLTVSLKRMPNSPFGLVYVVIEDHTKKR